MLRFGFSLAASVNQAVGKTVGIQILQTEKHLICLPMVLILKPHRVQHGLVLLFD